MPFIIFFRYQLGSVQEMVEVSTITKHPIEEKQVISIFKALCIGVNAFHKLDPPLAHRDIKVCFFSSSPWPNRQNCTKSSVEESIFYYIALYFECQFNKNSFLKSCFLVCFCRLLLLYEGSPILRRTWCLCFCK